MRTFLVPAALVVAVLSLPAPAHAAATCQGRPATIEASTGAVMGTPGPDVIVATGSVYDIDSGAGDDTVCIVDVTVSIGFATRTGNDTVDASAAHARVEAYLGSGVDTYVGGDQSDIVSTAGEEGLDTITTGAGRDSVVTAGPVTLDLGDDNDQVLLHQVGPGSIVDLGPGRDVLEAAGRKTVRVDLARARVTIDGSTASARNVENVLVIARRAVVVGDDGPNRIQAATCQEELSGGGGDDSMRDVSDAIRVPGKCLHHSALMDGGPGADFLRGSRGDDALVGGAGHDTADGARGADRCVAEDEESCES